jgi:hypothetical protein
MREPRRASFRRGRRPSRRGEPQIRASAVVSRRDTPRFDRFVSVTERADTERGFVSRAKHHVNRIRGAGNRAR